jgi:electron transport complex protein RnfD
MAVLNTRGIMLRVAGALVPGIGVTTWLYGAEILANLALTGALCLLTEAACLALLRRPLLPTLTDGSSLVTGLLLALALPPGVPWAVLAVAAAASVGLGKYLYGGLGSNPFNPAMVGYALVLVSFPAALAAWPPLVDGISGATALDRFGERAGATVADLWRSDPAFGLLGAAGIEWANWAFAIGGGYLLWQRLARWRVTAGLLAGLGLAALLGYDSGSSASLGSPAFHWFSGGTMLAAFFIATDPVTHPASDRGQWLFGALVGVLIYLIRSYGSYPDGIAFAILLANSATPWIDQRMAVRHA